MPAESCYHAIGSARVFHLDHGALARLIRGVRRLRDHSVQAGAFEPLEPLRSRPPVFCHGRQVERWADLRKQPLAAKTSKATNEAGVACASLATRDAAGCRRICSASKSRPWGVVITISPSTTQPRGSCSSSASCKSDRKSVV